MGSTGAAILFCWVALSVVAVGSAAPADNNGRFISKEALACSSITETSHRKLGGLPGVCPVQFEGMPGVSTVINSCRAPQPSARRCCGALKTFACPYRDLLNDNDNNGCASEMFYEIIARGRLTPGLFSYLCHDDAVGLQC
ncbi:hypothetical protein QOZ80_4BG0343050 [Eleusine coracana subsp. coracana]|nr:hypothetical protein QOZ80_4BG0343050 [Eleusine coracana subsp. coracana]